MQITVTFPDHITRRVNEWAAFTQLDVNDIVTMAIESGLLQLSAQQARLQATTSKPLKHVLDEFE
jgi:hypothetical protein